jgi:very-short-patch-repair endonuclease
MLAKGYPEPEREYRFDPKRKFRFDFCWRDYKLALEIEGGVYSHGRHLQPKGYTKDVEKYNLAVINGFKLLRFTGEMLDKDPVGCIEMVKGMLA